MIYFPEAKRKTSIVLKTPRNFGGRRVCVCGGRGVRIEEKKKGCAFAPIVRLLCFWSIFFFFFFLVCLLLRTSFGTVVPARKKGKKKWEKEKEPGVPPSDRSNAMLTRQPKKRK
jgi:hypothetical protein